MVAESDVCFLEEGFPQLFDQLINCFLVAGFSKLGVALYALGSLIQVVFEVLQLIFLSGLAQHYLSSSLQQAQVHEKDFHALGFYQFFQHFGGGIVDILAADQRFHFEDVAHFGVVAVDQVLRHSEGSLEEFVELEVGFVYLFAQP